MIHHPWVSESDLVRIFLINCSYIVDVRGNGRMNIKWLSSCGGRKFFFYLKLDFVLRTHSWYYLYC